MSLTLLVTAGALVFSAYQYLQSPKEPAPAKTAPAETVNIDEFLKQIKPKNVKPVEEKPEATEEQEKPAVKSTKYSNETKQLLTCAQTFDSKVGQKLTYEEERLRSFLEFKSDENDDRGDAWVTDLVKFSCAVLVNNEVIEYNKKNSEFRAFGSSINFHLRAWDQIKQRQHKFENDEQNRIESERTAESIRVTLAKAQGLIGLGVAGAAFAIFMALALYLIISSIESSIRKISEDFEDYKKSNKPATE
jgi:hypothetical protein